MCMNINVRVRARAQETQPIKMFICLPMHCAIRPKRDPFTESPPRLSYRRRLHRSPSSSNVRCGNNLQQPEERSRRESAGLTFASQQFIAMFVQSICAWLAQTMKNHWLRLIAGGVLVSQQLQGRCGPLWGGSECGKDDPKICMSVCVWVCLCGEWERRHTERNSLCDTVPWYCSCSLTCRANEYSCAGFFGLILVKMKTSSEPMYINPYTHMKKRSKKTRPTHQQKPHKLDERKTQINHHPLHARSFIIHQH